MRMWPHTERAPAHGSGLVDARGHTDAQRTTRFWAAGLMVLCAGALALLFGHIRATMPYPYHADEGFISGPASKVLVRGDLHPERFNYPSLPTYIAATSMAVGFLRGAAHLELRDVNQIGRVGYPYYESPRVMQTARQAFALLSVLCLAMTGLSAWLAFRTPATIVVAPLILFASPLYLRHSWVYLNVDIVGASFVMLTVAACLAGLRRPSIQRSALLPGAFAGLAVGSKYTLGIVVAPVLLSIALYSPRTHIIGASLTALVAMVAAFIAVVPYSVLDIPAFLNGVGYEIFHYASGHAGFAGDPGWPQFLYYSAHLVTEFGYGATGVAILGVAVFVASDWRRAAVVSAFPAALLWVLTTQRVHFTRNALAIQPFVAMFAAYGLVTLHGWMVRAAARHAWVSGRIPVSALAGAVVLIATVPVWHLLPHFRNRTDSRNLARAWMTEHLPPNWAVVVPTELGFDLRGLDTGGRHVKVVALRSARDPAAINALLGDVPSPAVMMVPRWGADRRSPGTKAADLLNSFSGRWRVIKRFGTNDVLVNYLYATAWGDPAFAIAIVK
jgi:hypothetical protein